MEGPWCNEIMTGILIETLPAPGETQSGVDVEHRRWTSIVDFQFFDRF